MPDVIKIGKTEQEVENRIRGLDTTGVPLPFECYYAAEVADLHSVEKKLHMAFMDKRVRDSREFFYVDPAQAKAALSLAELKDVTPKKAIYTDLEDKEALERESKRATNFSFSRGNIPIGATLSFIKDEMITARVVSDRSVEFEGHETSLSKAGLEAIRKCGYDWTSLRGPEYWVYEGNSILWHIKNVEDKYEDK